MPGNPTLPVTATATDPEAREWPCAIATIGLSCGTWMTCMVGWSSSASRIAWVAVVLQLKTYRTPAARSCSTSKSPPVPSTALTGLSARA